MASSAFNARQRGLALIGRLNRWLVAGAIALSGGLSVAAANTFHGRTRGQNTSTSTAAASHRSSPDESSSNNNGAGALQPPAKAPSSASASTGGAVVSGGS